MAEKLISIPENDQLQALCGNFDENLKLLEQRYQVSVVCRGEDIRIHGTQAQAQLPHSSPLSGADRHSRHRRFTMSQKWWKTAHPASSQNWLTQTPSV